MKRTVILLLTIAVALIIGDSIDAKVKGKRRSNNRTTQSTKLPASINELMRFTDKYSNRGSRFVHLAHCPTRNDYIKTIAKENEDWSVDVKIYINKQSFQRFKFEMTVPADVIEIHYLDANFDGYTDIFVGKDQLYTHSGVYLWNPDIKCFEEADFRFIDVFFLDPANKLCYFFYNDMNSDNYYKYYWEGRKMKCIEFVTIDYYENSDKGFDEYIIGTGDPYGDKNTITIKYRTTDKKQLPQWWKDFTQN